jgi:hypothetical protein
LIKYSSTELQLPADYGRPLLETYVCKSHGKWGF